MVALASGHDLRHPYWKNALDESGRWAATAACVASTERPAQGAKAAAEMVSHVIAAMPEVAVLHRFVAKKALAVAVVVASVLPATDNAMEGGVALRDWRMAHFRLPCVSKGRFQSVRVRHGCIVHTSSRAAQADVP